MDDPPGRLVEPRSGGTGSRSFVETDLETVAILDTVLATLEAQQRFLPCRRVAADLEQAVPRHDLRADETLRQVAVDLPRGIHRPLAVADRPGAHLVGADREERDQAEQAVAGADDERQAVVDRTELLAEGRPVLRGERDDLALEIGGHGDGER